MLVLGDVGLAEDAVQEATIAALGAWPVTGVPPEPGAWLTVTARRKAIDILRRERVRADKERLADLHREDVPPDHEVADDLLRLIFTCCHPTLSPPTRVALALRTLCGLTPAQIASVLLTTWAAVEKRLTRARQKIAAARIPYRVPPSSELSERLPAVCGVVHSLYTTGHADHDVDMCAEAIRDRQDRTRWNTCAIGRGVELLNDSLRSTGGQADAYQLQAAIAAEHALAPSYGETNWAEIVRLYDLLVSVAPSEAAALGRVVAVAEATGPAAGLALLADLSPNPRVHAVRAELLAREHRYAEAAAALADAFEGPSAEVEYRRRRREEFLALANRDRFGVS